MTKILLVEDDTLLLDVMKTILETEGYEISPAEHGRKALDLFVAVKPDLIISDIMMPEMDGYELLESIRAIPGMGATVPFLFLSARTDRTDVSKARALGVDDYLFKPFDAPEFLSAVASRLERRRKIELFDTRSAHLQTVLMLANVIETRDPYTADHVGRVRRLALNLGFSLGWPNEEIVILEFGSVLHDIGKIIVPRAVLKKTGNLTEEEWQLMRQHPQAGAKILEGVDHLRDAIPYVLCHHEWWNGGGYPQGLAGEKIPKEGRLLAIVDAFDAMTNDRPYHTKISVKEAFDELTQKKGVFFDPKMVDVFIRSYKGD
jgi:putative two-component system response regulator